MHTQLKLIVKNELVHTNGNNDVVSGLVVSTLNVAQQSSNFSNLNTLDVVVSVASLEIGIDNGVLPDEQVYNVTGLVLQNVAHDWPKNPLSQVSRQLSFWHTLCWSSKITFKISEMQFSQMLFSLLHI